MINKEKALRFSKIALKEIDEALYENNIPNDDPRVREQLAQYRPLIKQAMCNIEQDQFIQNIQQYVSMGREIVDCWPLDYQVGSTILRANDFIKRYHKHFPNNPSK